MSPAQKKNELAHVRDTVESVYIAIVLAFVLRAFMIEAFVIPTGSMANSLYGEHYQLTCPCCGFDYAFGVQRQPGQTHPTFARARCPNCGYDYATAGAGIPAPKKALPKGGDRVLVLKYLYDFREPQPWDVVVFKNPQTNRENYIKRLIGRPGEAIQIVLGDVYVSTDGGKTWGIRRKPLHAQETMWQVVFDNDYRPDVDLAERAGIRPPGWEPGRGGGKWDLAGENGRVFAFAGGNGPAELDFKPGRTREPHLGEYRPKNGYNAPAAEEKSLDLHSDLCTDWKLSTVLMTATKAPGKLCLTFERRARRLRGEFRFDGTVRLLAQSRDADALTDTWQIWGEARVEPFTPGRGRRIALSNADCRARLWVDGRVVLASSDEQFPGDFQQAARWAQLPRLARDNAEAIDHLEARLRAKPDDEALGGQLTDAREHRTRLAQQRYWRANPSVHLSASGAPAELRHVRLDRDVYYTASIQRRSGWDINSPVFDYYRRLTDPDTPLPERMRRPEVGEGGWGELGQPIVLKRHPDRPDLDEFFCLGDNSTQSHDGRSWISAAPSLRLRDDAGQPIYQLGTVPRYNLLGRAVLVYWPAGFRLPVMGFPIVPNVGRMRLIR